MKVLIGIVIFLFIILVLSLIGPKIDRKDIKKKQKKILESKGFKLDKEYIGKKFTKFDIYLDTKKKKLLLFNNKFFVYNFKDLTNFKADKEVNEGKFKYTINFKLKDKEFEVVLKGSINETNKLKYEELVQILNYVDLDNKNIEIPELKKENKKSKSKTTTKTTRKKSTSPLTKEPAKKDTSKKKTTTKKSASTKKTATTKKTTTPKKKAASTTKKATTKKTTKEKKTTSK